MIRFAAIRMIYAGQFIQVTIISLVYILFGFFFKARKICKILKINKVIRIGTISCSLITAHLSKTKLNIYITFIQSSE